MVETPEMSVELTIEDGFLQGYLHGLMAAIEAPAPEIGDSEACEGCECGLSDPLGRNPEYEAVELPYPLDFRADVMNFLERHGFGEEEIVSQVVICPEKVRILRER